MNTAHNNGAAEFSPDRKYRYTLWRERGLPLVNGYVQFIGLNPSTADETTDDPTVTRMWRFAWLWGYGRLCVTNAFAYRATDPRHMMAQPDPVGANNDDHILTVAHGASLIVCAWGVNGTHMNREAVLLEKLSDYPLCHLGLTKRGHPKHPLYLRGDLRQELWRNHE